MEKVLYVLQECVMMILEEIMGVKRDKDS